MSDLKAFKRWEEHRIENLRQLHSANGAQHILECYAEIDRLTTAQAKAEGAGITREYIQDQIDRTLKLLKYHRDEYEDHEIKQSEIRIEVFQMALRGMDAGTRGEEVDPHLLEFCRQMQKQLDANKERGDWKEGITGDWFDEGVKRNLKDMKSFTEPTGNAYRSRAAVDLANFALMFWAAFNKPSPPLKKGA